VITPRKFVITIGENVILIAATCCSCGIPRVTRGKSALCIEANDSRALALTQRRQT
jgi:hypothetical protein